jgi:CRP-like cAMP-binding protein
VKSSEGTLAPVASLGAGESLCEMALLSQGRPVLHLCSVVAEVDSKALEISSADLQGLMKDKPQACVKLLLACAAEVGRKAGDARDLLKHMLARSVGR